MVLVPAISTKLKNESTIYNPYQNAMKLFNEMYLRDSMIGPNPTHYVLRKMSEVPIVLNLTHLV